MSTETSHIANRTEHSHQSSRFLRLLAVFKFVKATLLLSAGFGALGLMRPIFAERVQAWVAHFAMSYSGSILQKLLALASGLPPRRLEALGIAAFFFAGLFLTEGIGLWFRKRWAEYLTVIATLSLVPIEVYELFERQTIARGAALLINIAVVVYLIHHIRHS